jgi:hypothetical protein
MQCLLSFARRSLACFDLVPYVYSFVCLLFLHMGVNVVAIRCVHAYHAAHECTRDTRVCGHGCMRVFLHFVHAYNKHMHTAAQVLDTQLVRL